MDRSGRAHELGVVPTGYRLPAATRLGRTTLQVSDLARSLAFYEQAIGLSVQRRDTATALLTVPGGERPLLELRHVPGTRPVARGATLGLFHFALLLPSRADLGCFVGTLVSTGIQFGAADHLVSEALYVWDPDGLGVEVYADRPRDTWQLHDRELVMATERLDVRSVMSAGSGQSWHGLPAGTTLGHMHLSVADLNEARTLYHAALGLDVTVWSYPGALFMSAGGYHHHLGTNTWALGARPPLESDARVLQWELVLPTMADVEAASASLRAAHYTVTDGVIVDPWGTPLRLTT